MLVIVGAFEGAGRTVTIVCAAALWTIEPELAAPVRAVLAPQGLIVVETSKGQAVHLPLDQRSSKVYGDTRITFLSEG